MDDIERVNAFSASKDLKQRLKEAGVEMPPEIYFIK